MHCFIGYGKKPKDNVNPRKRTMHTAPRPEGEADRIAFLHALNILDTEPEECFDSLTRLARRTLGADYSAIALLDSDRQWFKSQCGLDVASTSRDVSFCAHTILQDRTMVVEDAQSDARFHDNPLVTGKPFLRSYMGHPIEVAGEALGALCVLYTEQRTFTTEEKNTLSDLARMAEEMISHHYLRETARRGLGEMFTASDLILDRAIQMNPEPTLLYDLSQGAISEINEPALEELNRSRSDIVGKPLPFNIQLSPTDRETLKSRLLENKKVKEFEVGLISETDETLQFLCSAEIVLRAGDRQVLVTGRNISRLNDRQSLFKTTLESIGGRVGTQFFESCAEVIASKLNVRFGLVIGIDEEIPSLLGFWDSEGLINGETISMEGLASNAPTDNHAPIHIPDHARSIHPQWRFLSDLGAKSCYGHPVISAEGELKGYLLIADPGPYDREAEHATFLLGILSARTAGELERQQMLRALEKERIRSEAACKAKGNFLANMSHELRTPMNAIMGFSQLMAQDADFPARHRPTLDIVNQSGEHLLCLINDVLEMSAIEAGQNEIKLTSTELKNFITTVESMLSIKAIEKGLGFTSTIATDVPDFIKIDQGKVRQILVNLIGNAIKFTETGRVQLRITNEWSEDNHPMLHFEVEDTGAGIASKDLGKLFQPFEQIDRKDGLEGTGLGLSICKGFIKGMDGQIGVRSTPGKGSVFHFSIPLIQANPFAHNAPTVVDRQIPAADQPSLETRVLIVDDVAAGRLLLKKLLAPLGVTIKEAKNGAEAVKMEEEWRPHMIFMDLRMPVMDGEQAGRKIKDTRGDEAPVIIAITASVFRENLMTPETPFDGYVSKPFRIDEVVQLMKTKIALRSLLPG